MGAPPAIASLVADAVHRNTTKPRSRIVVLPNASPVPTGLDERVLDSIGGRVYPSRTHRQRAHEPGVLSPEQLLDRSIHDHQPLPPRREAVGWV